MQIIFSAIFIILFFLLNLYIYKRFVQKISLNNNIKLFLKLFLLLNYFGILLFLSGRFLIDLPYILHFISTLSIGITFIFFVISVIFDILNVSITKIKISNKRRGFIKKSLAFISIGLLSSLSIKSIFNARYFEVKDVSIKIKNLKKPYKIIQISDVHISKLIDKKFIKTLVEKINTLNADIVVITGDLIDTNVSDAKEALNELKNIKSKYGTYYIVGNHEYFYGIQHSINAVKQLGIKVLENENIYIGEKNNGFNLAGVYDLFGYRANHFQPDIKKALKNKQNSPTVLLAHQPKFIHEVKLGVDLILSGHTHGGQIVPFNQLVKLQQPYVKGLHQHNKNLQIYINQGTGFWGPAMRLGTKSEITHITIS